MKLKIKIEKHSCMHAIPAYAVPQNNIVAENARKLFNPIGFLRRRLQPERRFLKEIAEKSEQ